ncbi:MAG: hypothetical protein COA79_15020 [Planctomycetota bacterium]|nr:MAG: hypothetical protein COA79_15020 [Planctomycetota bacterium]
MYYWLKVIHLFFIIGWMATLFYLPRIFVHFQRGKEQNANVEYLKVMASKLFAFMSIMGFLAIGSGLCLAIESGMLLKVAGNPFKWLFIKMIFVFCLILYHISCYFFLVKMKKDELSQTHIFFRFYNELPTLLMIPILYYAVFKSMAVFAN